MSARTTFLTILKQELQRVNGGRWFVKRGPINWSTHPFDGKPFAMAIVVDDFSFAAEPNDARITIEAAGRMPDGLIVPQVDDGLLDSMMDDIERALAQVALALDPQGDAVTIRMTLKTARGVEFHDSTLRVQGVIVSFVVTY